MVRPHGAAPGSDGPPARRVLHHHQAAVDGQHLAGDVRGFVRGEERDGVRDLVGRAEPAERRSIGDLGLQVLGQVLRQLGQDEARARRR